MLRHINYGWNRLHVWNYLGMMENWVFIVIIVGTDFALSVRISEEVVFKLRSKELIGIRPEEGS